MCVPSLNEIHESVFELSCTQIKTYGGGGVTDVKPIYPRLSSGDINRLNFRLNIVQSAAFNHKSKHLTQLCEYSTYLIQRLARTLFSKKLS